ncbi:hypothetical protein [Rhizobium sp. NFR07]|uniref:hypothetical protein n=1 Tax=Rhizobium sp. NFR07 TaxID=1566262 RepID=UPI0015A6281E|nr:hypothetical protein [Rhizobium sp. NFR07]
MLEACFRHDPFEVCFDEEFVFGYENKQLATVAANDFLRCLGAIIDHEHVLHWQAGALSPQPPAPTNSFADDDDDDDDDDDEQIEL